MIELVIELGSRKWVTANVRRHRMSAARDIAVWRDIAAWRSRKLVTEPIQKARVIVELSFPDNRRRDPANWAPTAKAVIDGMVDSGVFPDDNHKHVTGPDMRIGPTVGKGQACLVVKVYPEGEAVPGE